MWWKEVPCSFLESLSHESGLSSLVSGPESTVNISLSTVIDNYEHIITVKPNYKQSNQNLHSD